MDLRRPARGQRYEFGAVVPFLVLHVAAAGVFFMPITPTLVLHAIVAYFIGMLAVTAGYHRYFAHRSFALGRVPQLILAWLAQTTVQKGVLWWVSKHRHHHEFSDTPEDVHSPSCQGFIWAHAGWILSNQHDATEERRVSDLARFPELRWLDRFHYVPTLCYGAVVLGLGGLPSAIWGWALPVVVINHLVYAVNSLGHTWGRQRFETGDESRNNPLLALLTLGEGWHNNHHFCMSSCRHGLLWWEIDVTFYFIWLMHKLGVVKKMTPFARRFDPIEAGEVPG